VSDLPRRCSSWQVAAKSRSSSPSSNGLSALERSLGSTRRDGNFSAPLTAAVRTAGQISSVPECECDKTLERLPPGINPPSVAARDSMACCQLCRYRQDAASRPTTKQQKDSLAPDMLSLTLGE